MLNPIEITQQSTYNEHIKRRFIMNRKIDHLPPVIRGVVMAIIYIAFTFFVIKNTYNIEEQSTRIIAYVFFGVILFIGLWNEYLRVLYQKAIKTLLFELKAPEAKQIFDDLQKKDFAKGYKNSRAIFDTLYYVDCLDTDNAIQTLEDHSKFFHNSLDNLLIDHYTRFYCATLIQKPSIVEEEYKHIKRMQTSKVKGKRVSPLYNWDFIDAVYYTYHRDYKKAKRTFENVDTSLMNKRELMHYAYQFAICLERMGLHDEAKIQYASVNVEGMTTPLALLCRKEKDR